MQPNWVPLNCSKTFAACNFQPTGGEGSDPLVGTTTDTASPIALRSKAEHAWKIS